MRATPKRRGPNQAVRGELNGNSRLSESTVKEILEDVRLGVPQARIASRLGVSKELVSKIARRQLWKHLTEASA